MVAISYLLVRTLRLWRRGMIPADRVAMPESKEVPHEAWYRPATDVEQRLSRIEEAIGNLATHQTAHAAPRRGNTNRTSRTQDDKSVTSRPLSGMETNAPW